MSAGETTLGRTSWRTPGRKLLRALVRRRLDRLAAGRVELVEGGERRSLGRGEDPSLRCALTIHDPRFYGMLVRGGSIGAAEAYIRGYWDADDLTVLIRILARDERLSLEIDRGSARVRLLLERLLHRLRDNSLRRSRRNIEAHYDLGNEFFATFLDPTMSYSCGIFDSPSTTLEQASHAKNDLICRKLELRPEHQLLEIGTGWGGFALHAARHYGCRVVSTTISPSQHALAEQRVRQAGLTDRITLLLEDYRQLPERLERTFDRLVSVEMIEAVGHRHLDTFFDVCRRILRPQGSMLLQAIVIDDRRYEAYRRSVDFIQRYIFPGGCLPSLTAMCNAMTRTGDLRIAHLQEIGAHYATTLRHWRQRFGSKRDELEALGLDERFRRMWEFYFCYCEGGFLERTVGDLQLLLTRPLARLPRVVPQAGGDPCRP